MKTKQRTTYLIPQCKPLGAKVGRNITLVLETERERVEARIAGHHAANGGQCPNEHPIVEIVA